MAVSTFSGAGGAGGAGLTDQGGEVVLARFKQGDAAISSADLPAGTYFLTAQGEGTLTVRTYSSGNSGGSILSTNISGSTTSQIVIPAGVDGVTFEGTYNGPVVFQTIGVASSVIFGAATIAVDTNIINFAADTWRPIKDSPYWVTFNNSYSTIVNADTGVSVTSTTQTQYAHTGAINGAPGSLMFSYNPSTETICWANGYAGGSATNQRVYRSTNQGLTWSGTALIDQYGYWDSTQFVGDKFFVTCGWTGTSQPREYFYVSSDDGASWTFRNLGTSNQLRKIGYDPYQNKYFAFTCKHPSGQSSTSYTDVVYDLGSDALGTTSIAISMSYTIYNWTDFVEPANGAVGGFFAIDEQANIYRFNDALVTKFNQVINNVGNGFYGQREYGRDGYQMSYVYTPADTSSTNAIPYLCATTSSGYNILMLYNPTSGTYGWFYVQASPFGGATAAATNVTQYSNSASGATRAIAWRNGYGHAVATNTNFNALGSPSGFLANYGSTNTQRAYFSKRHQKAYFNASDNKLYRSENATLLAPGVQLNNTAASKFEIMETASGTVFAMGNNPFTIWRSTNSDATTFTTTTVPGVTYVGSPWQYTVMGDIIAAWNGNTVGADSSMKVSFDQGASFISVAVPQAGNSSNLFQMFSDGTALYGKGSSNSQIIKSTDGYVWTETGQTTVGTPWWKIGNVYFSQLNNTTNQYFFPGNGISIGFNHPNPAFSWVPVQFGSGYALFYQKSNTTVLDYFYTSENGISWTFRSGIIASRNWTGGFGADDFAVIYSNTDSIGTKLTTNRTVTI